MGYLDEDTVKDNAKEFFIDYGSNNWKDSCNHSYQDFIEGELSFAKDIEPLLKNWICNLDINVQKKFVSLINNTNIYINLNYTSTLEYVYKIMPNQIWHIHGSTAQPTRSVAGHNHKNGNIIKPQYDLENDDRDFRIIEADELIKMYFQMTYKDTNRIIEDNMYKFNYLSCCNIKNVYVLGHSISDIDLPYFDAVNKKINNSNLNWIVSCYFDNEEYHLRNQLSKIGI